MEKTAIMIDGAYFLKRYRYLTNNWREKTPEDVARGMYGMSLKHLRKCRRKWNQLYRVFYYDCPPVEKRVQNPISNEGISLDRSYEARFRREYFEALKKLRKVALRLGHLSNSAEWKIKDFRKAKDILSGRITRDDLEPNDLVYTANQKGVDMMVGVDIASLVFKKQVDQIILISGDSDFVPAAKLARREGIDFILDPMWNHIQPDLHEHIDGLQSTWNRPQN